MDYSSDVHEDALLVTSIRLDYKITDLGYVKRITSIDIVGTA